MSGINVPALHSHDERLESKHHLAASIIRTVSGAKEEVDEEVRVSRVMGNENPGAATGLLLGGSGGGREGEEDGDATGTGASGEVRGIVVDGVEEGDNRSVEVALRGLVRRRRGHGGECLGLSLLELHAGAAVSLSLSRAHSLINTYSHLVRPIALRCAQSISSKLDSILFILKKQSIYCLVFFKILMRELCFLNIYS